MKGIVYYTHHYLPENIMEAVQDTIRSSGLPVVSVSLRPMDFGKNVVLDLKPGVMTMFKQILAGLEASKADTIFLAEHDIFYHSSHFDFNPPKKDTYYYNANVWRWDYPKDRFITYDHLTSLSGLCADRELLLNHYQKRLEKIAEKGWEDGRDPNWARKIGYEPGKKRRRGGFLDEPTAEWRSEYPNIDIRHKRTITPPKVTLDSFRHPPTGWRETTSDRIEGWESYDFSLEGDIDGLRCRRVGQITFWDATL
jgi:hypothetical protein